MLSRIANLKNIRKFLIYYHNKLKLYHYNIYNFYLNILLLKLYNFNKSKKFTNRNNIFFKVINFEDNKYYKIDINTIDNIYFMRKTNLKIYFPNYFTLKVNL